MKRLHSRARAGHHHDARAGGQSHSASEAALSAASIVPPRQGPAGSALRRRGFRHLHDAIDEQAQADLGRHPASLVGAASPASCKVCSTERIEAGDRLTPPVPAKVLEPTGWPLAI
jgi:hypothetical protein